jgi:hypothetical protein
VTFNDPVFQYLKHSTILILTTCFRKQISSGACSGDSRTSIIRPPPALLPRPRAALATSVVAHAVVDLETQLIELKRQLGTK